MHHVVFRHSSLVVRAKIYFRALQSMVVGAPFPTAMSSFSDLLPTVTISVNVTVNRNLLVPLARYPESQPSSVLPPACAPRSPGRLAGRAEPPLRVFHVDGAFVGGALSAVPGVHACLQATRMSCDPAHSQWQIFWRDAPLGTDWRDRSLFLNLPCLVLRPKHNLWPRQEKGSEGTSILRKHVVRVEVPSTGLVRMDAHARKWVRWTSKGLVAGGCGEDVSYVPSQRASPRGLVSKGPYNRQ